MKRKRIMRFFLALVMFMGCLPLNSIPSYANDDINGSPLNPIPRYANDDVANDNVNDGVKIDDAFPDENFSKYVRDKFDKDKNGYLSDTEVAAVTELSIGKQGISSLNGIGFFKNLTKLDCSGNRLTNLDVSHNTELTTLECNKNNLENLDVSHNAKLTKFFCSSNKLANLDISHNTDLTELGCSSNKLSSLDVSHNTELTTLVCSHNKLTSLNLSNNTKLTTLNCDFNKLASLDISHNTDLTELNCTKNNLKSLDVSNNKNLTKLSCGSNNLKDLDVSHNTELSQLYCDVNELTSLDLSQNTKLTQLACDHNNLTSLAVSNNTNLTELNCANNNLENLNVNGNTELTYLECGGNNLKNLDISNNTNLTELWCRADNLTELNVDNNRNLTKLWCYDNKLTSLNLSNNTNLTNLQCYDNNLTSLDLSNNKRLTYLECYNNKLTSLDLSNNTNLTELSCGNQQYNILINKGAKKFEYSNFPGKFKKDKVISQRGAYFGDDALTVYSDTITYKYKVAEGKEMDVELNVTYFDPENVEKMEVKTPPKLSYTEGDRLDLTGLVVTLKDKQGAARDVAFKDFNDNKITVNPENNTELTVAGHNEKAVKLTRGKLTAETNKLTVAKKVEVPDPANPGPVQKGYTRVTFDAGDGNTIDGNRYKVIDVLTGTAWDNEKVKEQIPASAQYKDNTKVFKEWNEAVPKAGNVEAKTFKADYKDVVKIGTDPNAKAPDGYTRVTFDAGAGNTIAGNRYKVIDVLTGTTWDNTEVTKELPKSAKYKDNTKVFKEWSEAVPTTGTVDAAKTFTADYKDVVKTGTDSNTPIPNGYTRVTFDAGDGNTVAGTNDRYKVIDVLNGTTWNDAEVTKEIPASAKYKDTTKVFDKWNEAVPDTGEVQAKTFTADYKDVVKIGTDPNVQVTEGYTRVTFDAGEGNTIAGTNDRYKVIDVVTGTAWDNAEVTKEIPATATYKDDTKVFKEWNEAVPTTGTVDAAKTFTAEYKDVVKTGTDPNVQVTEGYTRVTFDAGEGNTIAGTNDRYKVIDVVTGTAWDNAEVTKEIPATATYKDNTKVFDKWKETVPKAGNVEAKTFTAEYKDVVKTGTNPNAQAPDGYTRVTFDAGEGNTIAGNRYKVIDVLNGTAWDNEKVKGQIPASAKYKDNTKVFDKWKETVPTKGNVEAKEFTAEYKAKELDKKHGAENPSVTPTPDVTPSPDVTPTPETKAGWQKDEKGWWYLRENGTYPAGEWEPVGETWYHFDAQGYMQTGWLNLDGTWYYLNADGSMAHDTWIGAYYVDSNGAWIVEGWQQNGYGWWYQRANGTYPAGEWEMINGIWYYFDKNGYMLADTTTPDGYYVDENGAWVK